MIRILYCQPDGTVCTDFAAQNLPAAIHEPQGLLWVDLVEEPADTARAILRDIFAFHPLAVDDALDETHTPKVDDWETYLYLVLHAVVFNCLESKELDTLELDIFLGPNYLVTYQSRAISVVGRMWEAAQRDTRLLHRGPTYLFYAVSDAIATDYMKTIEALDDQIDTAEDQTFTTPNPALLEKIFTLKRTLLRLRRILGPQREVFNKLARDEYAVVPEPYQMYFRDVYDHLVRLYDISDTMRDLVAGVMDMYLSVVNNRMNDVMKTLTIITTLFMPLSFLVGFFGMNFFQPAIPLLAWTDKFAFGLTLAVMVLAPVSMYWWMRKRAWM